MSDDILNIFDDKKYVRLAIANNKKYLKNKPFPHIYFNNFLPEKIALMLFKEYPKIKSANKDWKIHKNSNVDRYFLEDSSKFKKNLRLFSMVINSRKFILFLETLTGIPSIIPDPYFMGGGAMTSARKGFLKVHADFNFHHKLQSWRRLNVLFYLTPNWKKNWGGNLELWTTNKKKMITEIEPLFNRVVIINSTSNTFHGQPKPLECPENISRNVFSAFYYTSKKDKKTLSSPHFTRYSLEKNPYAKKILDDYKNESGY